MTRARPTTVLQEIGCLLRGGTTAALSDEQLLRRYVERRTEAAGASAGANDAFAALVDRHGPMVWGVCQRILRDRHDAEDAFQATFLILASRGGSVRVDDSLGRWLHGVARRVAARARANQARRRSREDTTPVEVVPSQSEAGLERDELRDAVNREVDRLPRQYREPIVLCHSEGLTYSGAAERLGWPTATLKGRLRRARDLLRVRLLRRGIGMSAAIAAALGTRETLAMPASLATRTLRVVRSTTGASTAVSASSRACSLANDVLRTLGVVRISKLATMMAAATLGSWLVAASVASSQPGARPEPPHAAPDETAEDASTAIGLPLPRPETFQRLLRQAAAECSPIDNKRPEVARWTMVSLGLAQARAEDAPGARETLRRASEGPSKLTMQQGLVQVARAQAELGLRDDARATLRRVLDALAADGGDFERDHVRLSAFAAAVRVQALIGPAEEARRLADRLDFFADQLFARHEQRALERICGPEVAAAMAAVGEFDAAFARAPDRRDGGRLVGEIAAAAAKDLPHASARRFVDEAAARLGRIADADQKQSGLLELAEAQARLGDLAEAKRTARSIGVGTIRPGRDVSADALSGLRRIAFVQRQAGDPPGARETLRECTRLTLDRTSEYLRPGALTWIAMAQVGVDDIDGALATIRSIPEGKRSDVLALVARAQAIAGDRTAARATMARALDDAPGAEEARKHPSFTAEVEFARLQASAGNTAGALRTMGTIRDEFQQANALRKIVEARASAGDVAEALRLALEPKSDDARREGLWGFAQGVEGRLGMVR